MKSRVLILGCGPSAALAAIELAGMGYPVQVAGELREFPCIEGVSERVFSALKHRDLHWHVSEPVQRTAIWSGEHRAVNSERLIERRLFDEASLAALRKRGIAIQLDRIDGVDTDQPSATLRSGQVLSADFVIDARGRAAGYGSGGSVRGPTSVSLCAEFQSESDRPLTLAMSQRDGWLWLARQADGKLFVQKTTGGETLSVTKNEIPDWLASELSDLSDIELRSPGRGFARSSTPVLVNRLVQPGYLRIGDAASAVDPLSGNGIFQALSSALTAVAVVNTMLQKPDDAELAMTFYHERVEHLFTRFARTGRDFYRSESGWADETFWEQRRSWPDNEPLHLDQDEVVGHARRPVINNGFIEEKEVVITRDQPLGIWLDR